MSGRRAVSLTAVCAASSRSRRWRVHPSLRNRRTLLREVTCFALGFEYLCDPEASVCGTTYM